MTTDKIQTEALEIALTDTRRALEDLIMERDFVTGQLERAEEVRDVWCEKHDARRDERDAALTKLAEVKAVSEGEVSEAIADRDTWIEEHNNVNSMLTVANERIRELEPTELGKRLTELTEQRDIAITSAREKSAKHIEELVELGHAAAQDLEDCRAEVVASYGEERAEMKEQLDERSRRCAMLETHIANERASNVGLLRQIDKLHDGIEDVRVARDAEYTFTPTGFVEKNAELHHTVNTQSDEVQELRRTVREQNFVIEDWEDRCKNVAVLTGERDHAKASAFRMTQCAEEAIEARDMWITKHAEAEGKSVRTQQELHAAHSAFMTEQANHDKTWAALKVSENLLQDAIDGKNTLCVMLFNVMKTATGRDYTKVSMVEDVAEVRAGYLRCAHLLRQGFNATKGYTAADGGEVGRWRVEARECEYAWKADAVESLLKGPEELKEWPGEVQAVGPQHGNADPTLTSVPERDELDDMADETYEDAMPPFDLEADAKSVPRGRDRRREDEKVVGGTRQPTR